MFNKITIWLICSYIFIAAIPHTPAARYILLGSMIIVGIWGVYKKHFVTVTRSPITVFLYLFICTALISALISPNTIESLQSFRKEYLPPLILILVATSINQSRSEKIVFSYYIACSLLAGFSIKTGLAIWDGSINNPFVFSQYSNAEFVESNKGLPKYVSYYAVESVLYLPVALAGLLYIAKNYSTRMVLILVCCGSLFAIYVSGIRSAVIAVTLPCLIIALVKLRTLKRICVLFLFVMTTIGIGATLGKGTLDLNRYVSILDTASYKKSDSIYAAMSGRYFIWEGVLEMIEMRPLVGFGPGWQKLPDVARETGLLSQWKNGSSKFNNLYKVDYFSLERGQPNPHNLFLQIAFEIGLLGLAAYIGLFISLIVQALKTTASDRGEPKATIAIWLKALAIPYALAYAIINITNALLLHNTMVALIIITILMQHHESAHKKPSF